MYRIFPTYKQPVGSETVSLGQFYIAYSQLVTIAGFGRELNNFPINAEVEMFPSATSICGSKFGTLPGGAKIGAL